MGNRHRPLSKSSRTTYLPLGAPLTGPLLGARLFPLMTRTPLAGLAPGPLGRKGGVLNNA